MAEPKRKSEKRKEDLDKKLDEQLEETFPSSDPRRFLNQHRTSPPVILRPVILRRPKSEAKVSIAPRHLTSGILARVPMIRLAIRQYQTTRDLPSTSGSNGVVQCRASQSRRRSSNYPKD